MTPRIVLALMGATVIGAATSALLMRATVAEAQPRACEHDGRKYQPGERACIEGLLHICSAQTGRWLATKVKC